VPDATPVTLNVPSFPRAVDYAGVWAIDPTAGAALWALAQRTDLAAHVAAAPQVRLEAAEYQTVKAGGGQQIAVVQLAGPLMKATGSMSAGTSTVAARRALRKAAADPDVSAILIQIDSPGGTVSGTADLAADVAAAAKQKPVWAFAEDLCASAAYWVASQCDKVFANTATAMVGSIGTLAVVYDLSAAAEQQGVKALVFGTGPLKGAGAPGAPVTEEQQAYFRGLVEDSQTSFDAAVRKGRGLTDKQLAAAKTGGVFGAAEALDRKLIDGVQSFDKTLADLAAEARRQNRSSTTRAAAPAPDRSATVEETVPTPAAVATVPAPVAVVPEHVAQMRREAAAEAGRIAEINRLAAGHPAVIARAVAEGWSAERAENAALRAQLQNAPTAGNPHTAGPHINFGAGRWRMGAEAAPGVGVSEAIEAALRMSMGRSVEGAYRPEVCQAAHESFRHFGLQQTLMLAAIQNGYAGRPGERIHAGNLRAVLKAAFGKGDTAVGLSADASTISMSGILGNVANKELLAGYVEEDMTWKEIAAIKSVSNFQQATSYRMLDDMEYEELGPDGRIKHGSTSEESYTRQAKTYAKMFAITRTQWINDDLGAFDDIRTRLGRGSSKKFNKVFWKAFLANAATFWTAARTNYISGATTNLGTDGVGIGLGVLAFRKMTSPAADGTKRVNADTQNPVGGSPGGRPEILLVPPELEGTAEVIYRNQNLGSVKTADANIYQNKYRPVVAWQLSDASYTNYSLTAWFLLNNPAYLASVVVSFLNGMMAPTVESADADFDQLGVEFRGFHDFGVDQAEYLAGVKSKGAA
jgi:signal peptide peptidase SppA